MAEHCLSAHASDKPYQCPECKETFASKSSLRFHLSNTHEKSEYICKISLHTIILKIFDKLSFHLFENTLKIRSKAVYRIFICIYHKAIVYLVKMEYGWNFWLRVSYYTIRSVYDMFLQSKEGHFCHWICSLGPKSSLILGKSIY